MKFITRILAPYESETINIRIKSRNLAYVIIVLIIAMTFICIASVFAGRFGNLASSVPALLVSFIALYFSLAANTAPSARHTWPSSP